MRLINRPQPVPNERLESLLERLRAVNHYEERSWVRDFLTPPIPERLDLLRMRAHYDMLAQVTGLAPATLYELTLHRFVRAFYGERRAKPREPAHDDIALPLWDHDGLSTYVHGPQTAKVCPDCWRERRALLLPWSLRHVTACPTHQVLLLDRCPACQAALRLDATAGCCRHCETPIAAFTALPLADHALSLLLTRLVWSALGCSGEAFPPRDLPLGADHPLWQMTPPTFLHWLWDGAQLIAVRDPQNPLFAPDALLPGTGWIAPPKTLRLGDVAAVHGALCALWRLLQYWPDTWDMTLERIAQAEDAATVGTTRFPSVLAETFHGPEWDWLHAGWMAFMRPRIYTTATVYPWLRHYRAAQNGRLPLFPPTLTQREAAEQLGIGEETLKRLIAADKLKTTATKGGDMRQWQLIEAESVRQLQLAREQHLTLAQAATYLSIGEEAVVMLVGAGMLDAESGPSVDGAAIWRFAPQQLADALQRLLGPLTAAAMPTQDAQRALPFPRVVRMVSALGVSLPHLLAAIQNGMLPAYRVPGATGFAGLWCWQTDIATYLAQQRRSGERVLLSVSAVCELLRCKPVTLRRLSVAGLLIPVTNEQAGGEGRWQYDERDVQAFQARYVTTDEAATLLGITPLTVQQWARAGRLVAVTGPHIDGSRVYRFDKATLLAWRHERLTFGEAMALLGVSKATLDRWVRQGKLTPREDMGGKQRWFRREEVEELCTLVQTEEIERSRSETQHSVSDSEH